MIYFITGNKDKYHEIKKIIPQIMQLELDLPEIQELDAKRVIEAKIQEALKHYPNETILVEDTSLYCDCMSGLPGPFIKWFIHSIGYEGLVSMTEKYGNSNVTARCIIGYAEKGKDICFFEATLDGKLVSPRGKANFGWDPIFEPKGEERTIAEMSLDEKNRIHPRGLAAIKLKEHLSFRDSNIKF